LCNTSVCLRTINALTDPDRVGQSRHAAHRAAHDDNAKGDFELHRRALGDGVDTRRTANENERKVRRETRDGEKNVRDARARRGGGPLETPFRRPAQPPHTRARRRDHPVARVFRASRNVRPFRDRKARPKKPSVRTSRNRVYISYDGRVRVSRPAS